MQANLMMLYLKRLENRTLAGLHLEELACLPQVEPAALVTDAVAGANVSLRCSVFGLPSASVSWWHSNRLVANGSELQHAWEDQYYSIAEYRSNDHQVRYQGGIHSLNIWWAHGKSSGGWAKAKKIP